MFDITSHVQVLNPKEHANDAPFEALNVIENLIRKESTPEDPPRSLEETTVNWQSFPPLLEKKVWLVWSPDQAEIIAMGDAVILGEEVPHNQHLVQFGITVLPAMRRQGIAKQLLQRIVDFAAEHDKRLLITNTDSAIPAGEACMQWLGAQLALVGETNQLELANLDHELMQAWRHRAQERAGDYELVVWEGPYPETDIHTILEMKEVMNTSPRDDMDVEDVTWTVEQVRKLEAAMLQRGDERWTMVARHQESGQIAGYTEVYWNPLRPEILGQGDTAVFPQYRGLGIGRWLKAAMVEKVLRERPEVKRIRTGNAASNAPMLKINHEIGFTLYRTASVWQIELEKVKQYLAV